MKEKTLTEKLLEKSDKTYKNFLKKIIPEINENSIIGVRMNEIRKIEKNSAETELSEFRKIKHEYLEEKLLHAINISKTKNIIQTTNEIEIFLPQIDNWYVCDTLRPKNFKKNYDKIKPYIEKWLESNHEYTVRFAIEMLMINCIENNYEKEIFEKALYKKSDKYYIQMMQAWCIAELLAKNENEGLSILTNKKLSKPVYKKAIQKARESRKINPKLKDYLKTLKSFT